MPRGIFFLLLMSALQTLNRHFVEIKVHVASRYSNEDHCRAFARVGGNFQIPMHYSPSEDMDVLVLVDAKVSVFRTRIWDLDTRTSVYGFK